MKSSDSKVLGNFNYQGERRRSLSASESPLLSPSVPPTPQPSKPFIMPPWTPNPQQQLLQSNYIQNNRNIENLMGLREGSQSEDMGMIDDESLPSIPDVPSPYSPPPASLFSGEEFPPKSDRKQRPLDGLSMNMGNHLPHQNQNIFNSSVPSDEEYQHQQHSHRQQLLPTILYLKKDLEESHASMHLLQQENKALAEECDRFQREMEHWNDQHTITVACKDEQIAELQKQLQLAQNESKETIDELRMAHSDTKQEFEKISKQLEASVASNAHLEACIAQLKQEAATKETEIKNLRSTIKDQSNASAAKLKETISAYDSKLQQLQDENKSLKIETDRLKAMNVEANQRGLKDLAKSEESYRAEMSTIQAELNEARKVIEELQEAKAFLETKSVKQDEEIKKFSQQLKDAFGGDASKDDEIKGLRKSLIDSTEREEKIRHENESLKNTMCHEAKDMKDEISRLQDALSKVEANEKALQMSTSQMTEALRESYTKYGALRSEKEVIEKELLSLKRRSDVASPKTQGQNHELQSEIKSLKSSLSKAMAKCNDLRAERSALTKKLSQYSKNVEPASDEKKQSPEVFKFDEVGAGTDNDDDLIPNRWGRIRDAAERAAIAKEHRCELHRLKTEYDTEVKRLAARHEQDLKDVFEEAKAEVTARTREIRRHVQGEYENKVANLERRYQSDLTRMQRECDKNTAVAEEAMKAAASELAAVTEQLDKESVAREALERNVRDLEHKLVTEQQKNKLSSEWMMNRKQWQRETNNLIEAIQQECNTVFTQNLMRTESPRSVAMVDAGDEDTTGKSGLLDDSCLSRIEQGVGTSISEMPFPVHRTPWKQRGDLKTSYNSPLDVSQALDETEALVRSLVGK